MCAAPRQHHFRSFKKNRQVERQPHVLNVEQIVLKLSLGLLHAGAIRVLDLRPPRDARSNTVTRGKMQNLLF